MFYARQKVVCIDDYFNNNIDYMIESYNNSIPDPVKGEVYIVEHVHTDGDAIWIAIIGFGYWDYGSQHFKPLVETEQHVSSNELLPA